MTDDSVVSLSDVDNVSDGEATSISLESLKQDIAKLQDSHRRCRNRAKQKISQLRESNEKHLRDYRHELKQREKDNDSWRRKFTDKCDDMKTMKREITTLKGRIKELNIQLKTQVHGLRRMKHLICDICFEEPKQQVTRCGHGFCASCLSQVFNFAAEVDVASCPTCRRELNKADDVWPIYVSEALE